LSPCFESAKIFSTVIGAFPIIPKDNGKAAFDQSPSTESSVGARKSQFLGSVKQPSPIITLIPNFERASSVILI